MESLARIFGSAARLRLLRFFLFNQDLAVTLPELSGRAKLSPSAARTALAELITAGLLRKKKSKPVRYQVNPHFEYLTALDAFIRQTTSVKPSDVLSALKKAGALKLVVLSGLFTGTLETQIDLLVVGDALSDRVLESSVRALEAALGREIRYATFSTGDFRYRLGVYDRLIRDVLDYPHRVLLDKIGI